MNLNTYKHPVPFFLLSTLIPWTLWWIAGYFSHLSPQSETLELATSGLAFLGLLAPNVVALVLIWPDAELRSDIRGRLFNVRSVKLRYWVASAGLMLCSILLAQAISLVFGYSISQFKLAESFSFSSGVWPVWFLLIAAPFFEELAWHSYGTDSLRARFSLMTTSVIFAVYWAIWHFPLSSIKDYYHSNLVEGDLIYTLNFALSMIPFVLIMNWLYYKAGRNITVAIIFHITAGYFNEIFQTHPMSKVIQTGLLIILSIFLILRDKDFFLKKGLTAENNQHSEIRENANPIKHKPSYSIRRNTMKKMMFIITLLAMQSLAFSQSLTQTIRGKVYDQLTQEALPFANIMVLDTEPMMGAMSDMDGNFYLERVPVGRHNIKISMMGYESYVVSELLVSTGQQPFLDGGLTQISLDMDELVVTISKDVPLNTMTTVSSRQFTVEESERYAGGMDDPARLASSFAGVATPSVVSNGISIRGNNPGGVLWRIEGVEAPNPSHFADLTVAGGGFITALSSHMIGNSDFYTGAFPAEYGNALSGVFDINLRRGNTDEKEFTFQAGVLGVDFSAQGPIVPGKKASYNMNYRYSTMGLMAPLLPDDTGLLLYQDLAFNTYLPTQNVGNFSFWGVGLTDRQEMVAVDSSLWISNFDRDNSQTSLYMYATGVSHKMALNSKLFINTTLSATGNGLSHQEQRLDYELQAHDQSGAESQTWRYSLQSSLGLRLSKQHSNHSGFTYSTLGYDVDIEQSQAEGGAPIKVAQREGNSGLLQVYTQSKLQLSSKLSMNVGVNAQYLMLNEKGSIQPRAGFKYNIDDKRSLALAYGRHSRIERLPVYFVDIAGVQPNKNLDLQTADHLVLAYNIKLNDQMRVCVEPYYQRLNNIPVSPTDYFSTINMRSDIFFNRELVSEGSGRNVGVDLTVERSISNGFYYLMTASLFDANYTDAQGVTRSTRFNKNYVVNGLMGKEWVVGKDKNNLLSVNGRFNYLGGNRKETIDQQASMLAQDVVYAETGGQESFADRHDDMPIISFTVSYRKNKPSYSSVWSLQVLNATAAKEYSNDWVDLRSGKVETKYEGIMVPNLSYKIQF